MSFHKWVNDIAKTRDNSRVTEIYVRSKLYYTECIPGSHVMSTYSREPDLESQFNIGRIYNVLYACVACPVA